MSDLTFRTHQCARLDSHDRHWVSLRSGTITIAGYECAGIADLDAPVPEQQLDDLVTKLGEPDWMRGTCQCYPAGAAYGPEPGNAWGCPQHGAEASAWRAGRDAVLARTDLVVPAADVIPKQTVLDLHRDSVVAGDFCIECGHAWPCATARLVAGGES